MDINGISVKLSGDQAKLMTAVSKSVTGSPKGTFTSRPQPKEDLLKSGKDFATVIPSGFLLLHQDLKDLAKDQGGGLGGSLKSLASTFGTVFAAVGAVAIAGTIVKGLFSGGSGDNSHIQDLIDQMNNQLTLDELTNGPNSAEIKAAQIQGVGTYMKSYFLAQGASAVVSETLGAIGTGAASAVTNLVNGLLGKETKDEAQLHLKALIDDIILAQESSVWVDESKKDGALKSEVRIGIMTYLGLWFAAQAVSLTAETVSSAIGSGVANVFVSFWNTISGKGTDDAAATHLKEVIDQIIINQKTSEWVTESNKPGSVLNAEVRTGIALYLGLWFAAQATKLTAETVGDSVGTAIGSFVNGFFTSMFGTKKPTVMETKVQEILDSIVISLDPKDPGISQSSEVLDAMHDGIASYVKVYFSMMATSAVAKTTGEAGGEAAASFFKKLLPWNWGKKDTEDLVMSQLSGKLQDILQQTVNAVDSQEIDQTEYINLAKEGITGFVQKYFETFLNIENLSGAGMSYYDTYSIGYQAYNDPDISNSVLSALRSIFTGLIPASELSGIQSQVRTAATSSIVATAKEIFEAESKKIKNRYSSSLKNSDIDAAFASVSATYLNAVKNGIEDSFRVSTGVTVNSQSDDRIIQALTRIQAQLDALTGNTNDLVSGQGTMTAVIAATGTASANTGPSVYSGLSGTER